MRIEEMMSGDEQILWRGEMAPEATFWEAVFNPMLAFALIWLVFDMGFLGTMFASGAIFSPVLLFFLVHMMPVWMYIGGIITAKTRAKNTHYCLTTRGVYIQTGRNGNVKFVGYDEIKLAHPKQGHFDRQYHVGDVVCDYVTPIVRYSNGKRRVTENFTIDNISDFEQVFRLINQQKAQIGPPMPAGLQSTPLTERRIPQQLQQPAYPVQQGYANPYAGTPAGMGKMPSDPYAGTSAGREQMPLDPYAGTSASTGEPDITDPQAAFFGGMQNPVQETGVAGTFLESQPEADAALLERLPDESVADLQKELFAGEALQTNAFPDPTVNPLPQLSELPKPQPAAPSPYAQRSAEETGPYALPPEQSGIWAAAPEPEMDSLDTSGLLNDPPFEDPTLRALEALKPQESERPEESGQFMQNGF